MYIFHMPDILKNVKYAKEQTEIEETMLHALNIHGDFTFLLTDLDENPELQECIMALAPNIRKYYPASGCIGLNNRPCKRQYMSVIRFILKHHGYELYSSDYTIKVGDGQYKKTKKYKIL